MNTFLKLAITALCGFIPCKANEICSCPRKDYLEGLPDYLEYRSAKDFLTSNETLYLKYLTWTVRILGIQCVTSTLRGPVELPKIPRWLYYTVATSSEKREQKEITLFMTNETYFTTPDLPQFGDTFPIVFSDSKCLIHYILKESGFGKLGCALWVKASSKDNPLVHCELIYLFFCDTSFQRVYSKEACDQLAPESGKRSR
uniref:Putative secreted salivary protein n=1 Tax=Ixodes scapularis TaxID=6945 RepID=Q4PMK1_IXOSC|nr:putative secreted salivary protein [Ixodes scapularis]